MKRLVPLKYVFTTLLACVAAFAIGRMSAPSAATPKRSDTALRPMAPVAAPALPGAAEKPDIKDAALHPHGREALLKLDAAAGCESREDERERLLEEWAITDPQGALEYARQHLKGDRLAQGLAGIATTWAKHDPQAAWNWARSLGPGDLSQAHTVLEQISKDDSALAARMVAEFAKQQPDDAVAMCLTAMRGMVYNGNFDAARKLADTVALRSPEEQGTLLNFMAGQWARFDPEQAAQWVQSLPEGQLRNQALVGLGESWAELDPPGAADFAAQLPAGEQRQMALRQAVANWILTDPTSASTWINKFEPQEDFDQAVAAVATMRFLMEERTDVALNWANSIFNPALREMALSEILLNWSNRDHSAALNYLQSAGGMPAGMRQRLLAQIQGP